MAHGIDISSWQTGINWAQVAQSNPKIDFVIPRCAFGIREDGLLASHVKGARDYGIALAGFYHFSYALNESNAKSEAQFSINLAEKYQLPKEAPIFYDFEYDSMDYARKQGIVPTPDFVCRLTEAFCEEIERVGRTAGIYANLDYYSNWYKRDKGPITDYIFWLADWDGPPNVHCELQQYSATGKVLGIPGNVDMNTWPEIPVSEDETEERLDIDELVTQVLDGMWGNGPDRVRALEEAGYSYEEVQNGVNKRLEAEKAPLKSVNQIAQEVIQGIWGNGDARKQRLANAGYDVNKIQVRVNEILTGKVD